MDLDRALLHALNGSMNRSLAWDSAIDVVNRNALFGGGVTMTVVYGLWFRGVNATVERRARLLAALIAGVVSVALGRAIALGLPMRIRPLQDPSSGTRVPLVYSGGEFHGWSSFPSDHAMVFGSIAVGVGYTSPFVGSLLLAHAIIFICIPRVMLGLHYPSDIVFGSGFGALVAMLLQRRPFRAWIEAHILPQQTKRPELFYACLFLLCYQLANMFHDARVLTGAIAKLFEHV